MGVQLIGPNPNTTPDGGTVLWDAARKGKAYAAAKVRRLASAGTWTPERAAELIARLDEEIPHVRRGHRRAVSPDEPARLLRGRVILTGNNLLPQARTCPSV